MAVQGDNWKYVISNALMVADAHSEEALVQVGASANEDYSYKDLATIGMGMLDQVK